MAVVELNKDNFEKEVLQARTPVLIDFWANWCGPCRMMGPVVEEIAKSMETSLKVGKVNIDDNPELAEKYNVMSIPTFVVLKNGQETGRTVGVQSKEEIVKLISINKASDCEIDLNLALDDKRKCEYNNK